MGGAARGLRTHTRNPVMKSNITEPAAVRAILISIALVVLGIFLMLPIFIVLVSALNKGFEFYLKCLTEPAALSAAGLTLLVAAITVPLNVIFGLAASWAIAKFDFWGKKFLMTLIDLPFTVSPVISGLIFVLLFGAQGLFGPWLREHDIKIIFAVPGIVIATIFVVASSEFGNITGTSQ